MGTYVATFIGVLLGIVIGILVGTGIYRPMRIRITAEIITRMHEAMKSLCYDDEDVWFIIKRMGVKIMPPAVILPGHHSNGSQLISLERRRQVVEEGYDARHDKGETVNNLIQAAMAYCEVCFTGNTVLDSLKFGWPWRTTCFKPKDYKRNLVRAGALIAAAIDKLEKDDDSSEGK